MAAKKTHGRLRGKRNLRALLDDVILRAKQNDNTGAARSQDLEVELRRIGEMVDQTLTDITKEVKEDASPEQASKATAKLDRTTKLLTSELMRLSAVYHRQVDTEQIRRFLSAQQENIRTSIDGGDESSPTLDERIDDLHSLMAEERSRVSRAERRERIKFAVSLAIAVVSLCISVYALWLR